MYNRAKHIDTRIYRIREMSESGEVNVYKTSGGNQPSDILTKSCSRPSFVKHRSSLMGECPSAESIVGIYYLLSLLIHRPRKFSMVPVGHDIIVSILL